MQSLTLPSSVKDAYTGQTNTRSNYVTKIYPINLKQGDRFALESLLYPVDYTVDAKALEAKDNRWHVICDLIRSDLTLLRDNRVIYSLVPQPPQNGDSLHVTHMRNTLEPYPVSRLGLVESILIGIVDSQFKPVVFNSGEVSVRLRYYGS